MVFGELYARKSETEQKLKAEKLLKQMFGDVATFRDGQWEAIWSVVNYRKTLLVQKTGWGKSIIYFLATRLLRDQGAGPTILISPLLSLMRNQIFSAQRIGLHAISINSANEEVWLDAKTELAEGHCDILLISPERLGNQTFIDNILPAISRGIGMFVVDEAHCISDWGHDFRPDYKRIVEIVNSLPPNVPVLATTATANNRVVSDIQTQLGQNIHILRGPLTRESLRIQTIRLSDQAERLAWLVENIPSMDGSGIIYCLTVADCKRVAKWLQINGLNVLEYYGEMPDDERKRREEMLLNNDVKALVATVALGMGFDKPDLGFVVHFQRPGSLVAYYQQIGRAGRSLENAYAILLNGSEDDEIHSYFINSAFPGIAVMQQVVALIEGSHNGLSVNEILAQINLTKGRVTQSLKLLEIQNVVAKTGSKYNRTLNPWHPDARQSAQVTQQRVDELLKMKEFVGTNKCLMQFVARELDDPEAHPCGRCSNCCGSKFFAEQVNREMVLKAVHFLQGEELFIKPRKRYPNGTHIPAQLQCQEGRVLCMYGDAGWGRYVRGDKYRTGRFRDELVQASGNLLSEKWRPTPWPTWVTAVPSLRHPDLVPDFARRVASILNLPYYQVISKVEDNPQQKTMSNSYMQSLALHKTKRAIYHGQIANIVM